MKKIALFPMITLLLVLFSCKNGEEAKNVPTNDLTTDSLQLDVIENEGLADTNTAEEMVSKKDASKLNPSQLSVQKLLQSCVAKDYANAASFIMYRGADQSRLGKDSFNYANEKEANTVKVTCEVINTWLGTSKSYEFISYKEEQTDFGTQYVVEVMFSKQKIGIERHFFYLMNSPKGLLLVNMV